MNATVIIVIIGLILLIGGLTGLSWAFGTMAAEPVIVIICSCMAVFFGVSMVCGGQKAIAEANQ